MTTRFESHLNKPSKLEVKSKHKVLQEFKDMQESVLSIKQERVEPMGYDPEPPASLKKHLYDNPDILTRSERAIP